MNLGERIRERREKLKITQLDLAQNVKTTAQHISALEQSKRMPSIELLPKLAEQLGVSIDYLVTGKEGIITDTVPAIKADKTLRSDIKKILIALVEELRNDKSR